MREKEEEEEEEEERERVYMRWLIRRPEEENSSKKKRRKLSWEKKEIYNEKLRKKSKEINRKRRAPQKKKTNTQQQSDGIERSSSRRTTLSSLNARRLLIAGYIYFPRPRVCSVCALYNSLSQKNLSSFDEGLWAIDIRAKIRGLSSSQMKGWCRFIMRMYSFERGINHNYTQTISNMAEKAR
jgi:hypothetical protein